MTQSKRKKAELDKVLHLAQQLSPADQDKLVKMLSRKSTHSTCITGKEFLESKNDLAALASNSKVKPYNQDEWKLDFWDEDEHNAFLEWRKEERERFR